MVWILFSLPSIQKEYTEVTDDVGGHLRPDVYSLIPLYIERHGIEAASEVAKFELSHVKAIKDVIQKEHIDDCDLIVTRNMNVYLDEARGHRVKAAMDALRDQGCAFVDDIFHARDEDAEHVRSFLFYYVLHIQYTQKLFVPMSSMI